METRTDSVEVRKRGEVGLDDLAQQGAHRDGQDITGNAKYVGGSKRPCRVSISKRLAAARVASQEGQDRGKNDKHAALTVTMRQ